MISGMTTFTLVHVVLSRVGIGAGLVAVLGLIASKRFDGWNAVFLAATIATSVTGFFFPFHGMTPGIAVGILSMIVLAIAVAARYVRHLAGAWRGTYVVTATAALYFNVFVLGVQLFEKAEPLRQLAPTQSEPPFLVAQSVVLALFVALGILAAKKFRIEPIRAV
jgi:hypothetical protein